MAEKLPLALDLGGRRCVCVGGGSVTARRVPALLAAEARVSVIAPAIDPALAALAAAGAIMVERRPYREGDGTGAFLLHVATGVPAVDRAAAAAGLAQGSLVCVAGEPSLGNCSFMAVVRRGTLLIGLDSGGAAPAVAAAIRRHLEQTLPDELGEALEALASLRRELRLAVSDPAERARRWRAAVDSGAVDAALGPAGSSAIVRIRGLLLAPAPGVDAAGALEG